jgi:hypothetical protein
MSWMVLVLNTDREKTYFSLLYNVQTSSCRAYHSVGNGNLSCGYSDRGNATDNTPLSNAKAKNECILTLLSVYSFVALAGTHLPFFLILSLSTFVHTNVVTL